MIDELFFIRITFSFFAATAVHCASDAATMVAYVECCADSGTGGAGGGGVLCANNKISTPRYSPLEKPAHPTDRPTGTMKQLFFGGGGFFFLFFACALRLSSRSNRSSRITTKMSPYFVLFDATIILYYYYPLNYVLQCLMFCYVWWLCMRLL